MIKKMEKLLHEGFAYVLGIKPEQVLPFISQRIEENGDEKA